MYISVKKYAKQHKVKRRVAYRMLNNDSSYRKVKPCEVGSNKYSINVFTKKSLK